MLVAAQMLRSFPFDALRVRMTLRKCGGLVFFLCGIGDGGGWVAGGEGIGEGFVEVLLADGFFVAGVDGAVFGIARRGFVDSRLVRHRRLLGRWLVRAPSRWDE